MKDEIMPTTFKIQQNQNLMPASFPLIRLTMADRVKWIRMRRLGWFWCGQQGELENRRSIYYVPFPKQLARSTIDGFHGISHTTIILQKKKCLLTPLPFSLSPPTTKKMENTSSSITYLPMTQQQRHSKSIVSLNIIYSQS